MTSLPKVSIWVGEKLSCQPPDTCELRFTSLQSGFSQPLSDRYPVEFQGCHVEVLRTRIVEWRCHIVYNNTDKGCHVCHVFILRRALQMMFLCHLLL